MFEIVMGIDDFLIQLVKYCVLDERVMEGNYTHRGLIRIIRNELNAIIIAVTGKVIK